MRSQRGGGRGRCGPWRGGRGRGRGRARARGRGGRGRHFGSSDGRFTAGDSNRGDNWGESIEVTGTPSSTSVCVAVEGCCHGELDAVYARLKTFQEKHGSTVDVLICCGDFQSLRNMADFHSMAVPPKYRRLGDFYRYYSGETVAPCLTIFVGGNHEAMQPLHELSYGGWVAPNIYYIGAAGVVEYGGWLNIGGISGIYKSHDYFSGRFERPPYDRSTLRSIYHTRSVDVYRLKCFAALSKQPLHIMVSHDWPRGIEQHGDINELLRRKPFFKAEVNSNRLGSPPSEELLECLKPKWWFAAHLHVKFKATVKYATDDNIQTKTDVQKANIVLVPSQVSKSAETRDPLVTRGHAGQAAPATTTFQAVESNVDLCGPPSLTQQMTQFLSLDKCLPRRQCISVLYLEPPKGAAIATDAVLRHCPEWLTVLKGTHDLSTRQRHRVTLPLEVRRFSQDNVESVSNSLGDLVIDQSQFCATVPAHSGPPHPVPRTLPRPVHEMGNPQTDRLLAQLHLDHVITVPYSVDQLTTTKEDYVDENEIELDQQNEEQTQQEGDDDSNKRTKVE